MKLPWLHSKFKSSVNYVRSCLDDDVNNDEEEYLSNYLISVMMMKKRKNTIVKALNFGEGDGLEKWLRN